jgi:dTDP-glucose pyrophosphorylase
MYASSYESTFLPKSASLREALACLNRTALRVCLAVDSRRKLLGVVTDGDIRRAILAGAELDQPIEKHMNRKFFSMGEDALPKDIRRAMRANNIIQVPILNSAGEVVALASRFVQQDLQNDVTVVLMAGGLGSRLQPLTSSCPKPMLPLNGTPMLEHIITNLRDQGFAKFYISLNYLGHVIEDYFGYGDALGVEIDYIREQQRLGTAGALSLLPRGDVASTLLVMNGDVITDMPFGDFVSFHDETGSEASMCVREARHTIQFGVVHFDDGTRRYISTKEKPVIVNYINAGVYCLSRTVLELIRSDTMFDMPDLFDRVNLAGRTANVYPCDSFWMDIGRLEDYERAQALFAKTEVLRTPQEAYSATVVCRGDEFGTNGKEVNLERATGAFG